MSSMSGPAYMYDVPTLAWYGTVVILLAVAFLMVCIAFIWPSKPEHVLLQSHSLLMSERRTTNRTRRPRWVEMLNRHLVAVLLFLLALTFLLVMVPIAWPSLLNLDFCSLQRIRRSTGGEQFDYTRDESQSLIAVGDHPFVDGAKQVVKTWRHRNGANN